MTKLKTCCIVICVKIKFSFNLIQLSHSNLPDNYIKGNKVLWTLYVGSNYEIGAGWSTDDNNSFDNYPNDYSEDEINEFHKQLLVGG